MAIIADIDGGNWNTNGAWFGDVQPGPGDDVQFIGTSGNVTIPAGVTAQCRSIDCTGYTGTLTFAATTSILEIGDAVGGRAIFVAGMTLTLTGIGTIRFIATTGSAHGLTTGGKVMPNITVAVGSTTAINLIDNTTATGATITLTSGSFNTTGKTVSCRDIVVSGATARTLILGASTITCTRAGLAWSAATVTNLTVSGNTATVTCNGAAGSFNSGAVNWAGMTLVLSGSGVMAIAATGAFTVQHLTRTGTAVKTDGLTVNGPFTVTGTLTLAGNSVTNRLFFRSSIRGTNHTITCNGTVTASNLDVGDITGAGSASWNLAAITGLSGDSGGNSGITFTTAVSQTATGTASFTWSTHGWTTRVPLPQDNVFVSNAFVAGRTITADMPRLGKSIDFTGGSGSPILSITVGAELYGSLILVAGVTPSGVLGLTFAGRSAFSVTSAGATFTQFVIFDGDGATYTLTDNFTTSITGAALNLAFTVTMGTVTANGNVSVTGAASTVTVGTGTTLNMGTGTWTLGNTAAIAVWTATAGTINASTSTIVISSATANTRTFAGGGNTYGTLTYTVAGSTGQLTITGANTFAVINFSDVTNARTLVLPASTTTTISTAAGWNVNGTAGKLMSVNSSSAGTAATLSVASGYVQSQYLSLKDSAATGGASFYAGSTSTDVSGNSGWVFADLLLVTDSDTGTASDAGETIAATLTEDDTASSTDAGEQIAGTATDDDTATGIDDELLASTHAETDTATAVDAGETVDTAVVDDDPVAADDAGEQIAATLTDTESGTATEAESYATAFTDSDSASAVDGEGVLVANSDGEGGTILELEAVASSLSQAEAAVIAEAQAIVAAASQADSATATDDEDAVFTAPEVGGWLVGSSFL